MPSFMTIPRELRDKICEYAITLPKNEVPNLEDGDTLLEGRESFSNPSLRAWSHASLIKYRPESLGSFMASSTPLLLVNHQLHDEMVSTIERMNSDYHVDIIVLKEIDLLPTWIQVPALRTRVDTVRVDFRIAGSFDPSQKYNKYPRYKGFRGADGAGPAMMWEMYSVLERFFKVGPTGERATTKEHRMISIKTLDINVQTPPGIDASRFGVPKSGGGYGRREGRPDHVLDPEYLTDFIRKNVLWMLSMGYHSAHYGEMFYEHLDEVVVRKDGEELVRYDVAEMFRDVRFTDSFSRREERFNEWKELTTQTRKALGLRVL